MAWETISPLIRQHLGTLRLPVFVYSTFRKGVEAQESKQFAE